MMNNQADNIYYNFRITQGENPYYAYTATSNIRSTPILEKASDYEVAVARFTLPMNAVPVFVWKGNGFFKVAMTFGASEFVQPLEFIPNSSGNDLYGDTIWTYQHFVDIINKGLSDCFNNLKLLEPTCPATEPPVVVFDSKSRLLSWKAQQIYGSTTKAYFNKELFFINTSFHAFEKNLGTEPFWEIISKDNVVNRSGAYYITKQEYSTLFRWNDFTGILFETDNIPVDSEYIMSQTNDFRKLLTDFEPLQDENNKISIQYFPQGEMRWYDLVSNKDLRTMDLKVYWTDNRGVIYPLYVDADLVFTMKLYFRKKISL